MTGSRVLRRVFASLLLPPNPVPAVEGPRIYFSTPSGGASADHHDHHDHHDHGPHHPAHGHRGLSEICALVDRSALSGDSPEIIVSLQAE